MDFAVSGKRSQAHYSFMVRRAIMKGFKEHSQDFRTFGIVRPPDQTSARGRLENLGFDREPSYQTRAKLQGSPHAPPHG